MSFLLYTFCFTGFMSPCTKHCKIAATFCFPLAMTSGSLDSKLPHIPASFAWAYLCKDAGLPPKVTTFLLVKDLLFIIYLHICCGCNTELAMVAGIQKWVRNPVSFWNNNSYYGYIKQIVHACLKSRGKIVMFKGTTVKHENIWHFKF